MKSVHQRVYKSASFHVYTVYGLASAKSFSYQINQEAVQNRREQEQIKEVDLGVRTRTLTLIEREDDTRS
jgi:hypothetical protein